MFFIRWNFWFICLKYVFLFRCVDCFVSVARCSPIRVRVRVRARVSVSVTTKVRITNKCFRYVAHHAWIVRIDHSIILYYVTFIDDIIRHVSFINETPRHLLINPRDHSTRCNISIFPQSGLFTSHTTLATMKWLAESNIFSEFSLPALRAEFKLNNANTWSTLKVRAGFRVLVRVRVCRVWVRVRTEFQLKNLKYRGCVEGAKTNGKP